MALDSEVFNDRVFESVKWPQRLKRKLSQGFSLFSLVKDRRAQLQARYSEPEEVLYYRKTAVNQGWDSFERSVLVSEVVRPLFSIAVIGCGAGREVFAFEKLYPHGRVIGFDISKDMIRAARSVQPSWSRAHFVHGDFEPGESSYDLIWVAASVESHIPGQKKRIQFYSKLREGLRPQGKIFMSPLVRPLGGLTSRRMGSLALLLLKPWAWEPGDSCQSYWGGHTVSPTLVYCHFFPNPMAFRSEVTKAGLRARSPANGDKAFQVLEN